MIRRYLPLLLWDQGEILTPAAAPTPRRGPAWRYLPLLLFFGDDVAAAAAAAATPAAPGCVRIANRALYLLTINAAGCP